jgi:MYXO-CTERM domain-containing protein
MLGGDFGEPKTSAQARTRLARALATALLLVGSFFLEAYGLIALGYGVRAVVAAGYLFLEVDWKPRTGGSLTTGLFWSLAVGWLGIVLAPFYYAQHVSIEHLLYIGGFGMLMLLVGSRVLFGHSGDLEGFFAKSWCARLIVFLGVLAATTRAIPAWAPSTTVSHHIYAAWTWALLGLLWLVWHRRRFLKRDESDEGDEE